MVRRSQFFSIGSGVGCHDEPAEFRNIRIRFTFLDLPYGARARVGGAHVTGGRYGDGTRTRSGVRGDGYGYCCRTFAAGLRQDRKSTRLNSSHIQKSRMPSSA